MSAYVDIDYWREQIPPVSLIFILKLPFLDKVAGKLCLKTQSKYFDRDFSQKCKNFAKNDFFEILTVFWALFVNEWREDETYRQPRFQNHYSNIVCFAFFYWLLRCWFFENGIAYTVISTLDLKRKKIHSFFYKHKVYKHT